MAITSIPFALFAVVTAIIYFIMPKKSYRWIVLLLASSFFYVYNSFRYSVFILVSIITIYLSANRLDSISITARAQLKAKKEDWSREERKSYKDKFERKKKLLLACALLFNFGILFFLKYFNFFSGSIATILKGNADSAPQIRLLLPLGISFYTFISTGYLIDVYREKVSPEKNIFKLALFISFFPHIIQGPISSFDKLHSQLIEPHDLKWLNFKNGIMLISWGLFKKLVVADTALIGIKAYYANGGINGTEDFTAYGGSMVLFICLLYALQLYADFSGGIDISRGICRVLGITLEMNFRQPYFSKSISEYWRRWHISLGLWMKNYVFYPIAMSGFSAKISRNIANSGFGKTPVGKHISKVLMTAIASFIVFLLVGIWHGANSKYIGFGVWNGLIIMMSALLEPVYEKSRSVLHIKESAPWWKLLQMIRTFIIVLIGYVFDISDNFKNAILMIHQMMFNQDAVLFMEQLKSLNLRKIQCIAILYGAILMLYMSIRLEKTSIDEPGELLQNQKGFVQWLALFALLLSILLLGTYGPEFDASEFVYMGF